MSRQNYLQLRNVVTLRNYQEECVQSVLSALEVGHKRLGISLATGSGKTVIFTQLIDRIKPVSDYATQTLILAHRRELVEQAARHCRAAYPKKSIEIEMGSMHASGTADITVASVRSITSGERLGKFDPERFKLVLVDEAHHIVAPGYLETLQHFGLDRKHPSTPSLVGVSATFSRFDGLRLGAAIDEIVYHKDYVDMIGDKWLSDVVFTTVESTADLSRVRNGANGDFLPGQLSKVVNTDHINEITVRSWMAKAAGRKSTLVFCVDLAHVRDLTQEFRKHGWDARFVTGDTPQITRGERLEAFRNQEFPVLVNCGVFTEGTDIPNVDCVVLARPTRSRNLLVQMIGRGMRLHPGKENCHVLDMVSTLETGIVTTPTLFGLDPGELVEAASLRDLAALKERRATGEGCMIESSSVQTGSAQGARVTFTEYESILDLIADTSSDKYIRQLSHYAWVQVGPDKYVLAAPSGSFIRIEKKAQANATGESLFRAVEVRALPPGTSKSPYAAPKELIREAPFAEAVHGSDKYASECYPHNFIHRYQAWRKLPPTENQLKFLNKLRGNQSPLTATDLDKGKAVDMITKIKHGARGRFAELEAEKRRMGRRELMMEQDAARKQREQVVVGPLSP